MTTEQLKIIALEERIARLEARLGAETPAPTIGDFQAAVAAAARGDKRPLEAFLAGGGKPPTLEAFQRWADTNLPEPAAHRSTKRAGNRASGRFAGSSRRKTGGHGEKRAAGGGCYPIACPVRGSVE